MTITDRPVVAALGSAGIVVTAVAMLVAAMLVFSGCGHLSLVILQINDRAVNVAQNGQTNAPISIDFKTDGGGLYGNTVPVSAVPK